MAASRDTTGAGARDTAITIATRDEEELQIPTLKEDLAHIKSRIGCCARVAPWVSIACCVLTSIGLGVWHVYTRRALAHTEAITGGIFPAPIPAMETLSLGVGWATLLLVIFVPTLLGATVLLSLLRTYQLSAARDDTSCGTPRKLSYGVYTTLGALLNLSWWLLTMALVGLLAMGLVWLSFAFVTSSALNMGITYAPDAAVSSAEYYGAARAALDGLSTYARAVAPALPPSLAAVPDVANLGESVNAFMAASHDVPVTVCPVNCLNMGSFYDVLALNTSCVCSTADIEALRVSADHLWKALLHALTALGLMSLASTWMLLHGAATYAHARRDLRAATGHNSSLGGANTVYGMHGDGFATVEALFAGSPSKKGSIKTPAAPLDQDAGCASDTAAAFAAAAATAAVGAEYSTTEPAAAARVTYGADYNTTAYTQDATPLTEAPTASPQRRASSPSPRSCEADGSASTGGRGATFNSTAQRYAAYRLRAAQAAAAKSSPSDGGRKQWVR